MRWPAKRADEALRESEERLTMAADSAGAGLWILEYHTGIFWITEQTRAVFGYSPDEVVDLDRFLAVVHPDDQDLVQGAMERAKCATEPVTVEYRVLREGDAPRWVVSRGRARFSATGEPDRLMGVSMDISERKRAQEALRASEARLETGVELAGLAFYEVDFSQGRGLCRRTLPQPLRHPRRSRTGPWPPGVLDGAPAPRRPPTGTGRTQPAA